MLSFKEFCNQKQESLPRFKTWLFLNELLLEKSYKFTYEDVDGKKTKGRWVTLGKGVYQEKKFISEIGIILIGSGKGLTVDDCYETEYRSTEKAERTYKSIKDNKDMMRNLFGENTDEYTIKKKLKTAYTLDPSNSLDKKIKQKIDSIKISDKEQLKKLRLLLNGIPQYAVEERQCIHSNCVNNKIVTPKQEKALNNYQEARHYRQINQFLRSNDPKYLSLKETNNKRVKFNAYDEYSSTEELKDERLNSIKQIKEAIDHTQLTTDIQTFRGVSKSVYNMIFDKTGRFSDNGFVSMTTNMKIAMLFTEKSKKDSNDKSMILVYNLKKGMNALPMSNFDKRDIGKGSSEILSHQMKGKIIKEEYKKVQGSNREILFVYVQCE